MAPLVASAAATVPRYSGSPVPEWNRPLVFAFPFDLLSAGVANQTLIEETVHVIGFRQGDA